MFLYSFEITRRLSAKLALKDVTIMQLQKKPPLSLTAGSPLPFLASRFSLEVVEDIFISSDLG